MTGRFPRSTIGEINLCNCDLWSESCDDRLNCDWLTGGGGRTVLCICDLQCLRSTACMTCALIIWSKEHCFDLQKCLAECF